MGRASDGVKCLALALLNYADDKGYFNADPILVRNFARPFDPDTLTTESLIRDLSLSGWIEIRHCAEYGFLGLIVNFERHQVVNRPKKSSLKAYFDKAQPTTQNAISDGSRIDHSGKGREGKGTDQQQHTRAREANGEEDELVTYLRSDWPEIGNPESVVKAWRKEFPGLEMLALAKKARVTFTTSSTKYEAPGALITKFFREATRPNKSRRNGAAQLHVSEHGEPGRRRI